MPTKALPLVLCMLTLLGAPASARTGAPELHHRPLGFERRRDGMLAAQIAEPFPRPVCSADDPPGNRCVWGKITLALSLLHGPERPESAARAGQLLRGVAEELPGRPGWKRAPVPPRPDAPARVDPGLDLPFLTATLLRRAVGLFGAGQRPNLAGRLAPEAERAIRDVFWAWASTECRIADADPAMVWRPWGSENHDVQRVHACWAGADLSTEGPGAGGRVYADGSTPAAQRAAWTAYWKEFIRSRAHGVPAVEFFSPTYSKYTLGVLYNLLDFSDDPALRRLAENAVTLWWAAWAQEQLDGVHGGSKARFYPDRMGAGAPVDGLVWLYLGTGRQPEASHPAHFPMLTSRYRLPDVVEALASDAPGRGTYEVWSRQLGLAAGPMSDGRYALSDDRTAVARYAFSAPGYVMGAGVVPRLPAARWTAISSQNRWNGVVLADGPDARVYATPAPVGGRSHYNAVLAAQSRGTQIVQRLPPPFSGRAGDMAIWVGSRLRRVEREGWIFVEGSAYVAARPFFGGYAADPARPESFRLLDQRSPVVIQAGTRGAHAGFEAFQAAVLATPLRVGDQEVEFQGLDGAGRLRFFLDGDRRPEVDGKAIAAPPGWSLHSPYVRQEVGSDTVEIAKGPRSLRLRFD